MNNAVDAGNGSSADNVDAVVQIFQGVGNINIYKVALDAGQQIFSAVSFPVGTFMVDVHGPSGELERIVEIGFGEIVFHVRTVHQNVVKRGSQYGTVDQKLRDPGLRIGDLIQGVDALRVDEEDLVKEIFVVVGSHDHKGTGETGSSHAGFSLDDFFREVIEKLHIEVVGVDHVRLVRSSAAGEIDGIDCEVLGQLLLQLIPFIGGRGGIQVVNQKKRFSGTEFPIINPSMSPVEKFSGTDWEQVLHRSSGGNKLVDYMKRSNTDGGQNYCVSKFMLHNSDSF